MEFKQLEMFVSLAEERTVQRAAERVFRTQPAVSMAIGKLEEEAGRPLFIRSRREPFHLTETGEVLYRYAKRLLELRDEVVARIAKPSVSYSNEALDPPECSRSR
jgi:DNA-binding transcriptional LysR family regulator